MSQQSEKANEQSARQSAGRSILIGVSLVLVTLIAFERIRHNEFIYDDLLYITQNPNVTNGLTVESIKWAFNTTYAGNWHPVTWLSHILDCWLFGLNPLWPHLENLLLHIVNTLLLFWILKSMTGAIWRSGFVAALFALHPVHIESVAWVAERKDLLCGLFWLLTTAAYVRYTRSPGLGRYLWVIIFFVLGLMSKPMIVTLPFVLLLLDYWPLKRLKWRSILEKLPLFVLATASSIITFVAQREQGAMNMLEHLPLNIRMANTLISYITYISKMIYPSHLAVLYPHQGRDFALWYALVSLGIIILVTIIALFLGRRKPYIFLGWFWYLGTLVPVIGFVQIGVQGMADRYTYLPSIGFFIMVTWGAAELAANRRFLKVALGISAVIVIVLLAFSTRKQVKYWQNNFTLFERAIAVTGDNPVMLYNMGAVLQTERQPDLAIKCYHYALKFKPDYFEAYINIGAILSSQGHLDEAISNIRKALIIMPDCPQAYDNLGLVLRKQGNLDDAIVNFRRAVGLMPDSVEMRHHLASALQAKGELDEAMSHYLKVLQLEPGYIGSLNELARILITHPNPELRNADEAVLLAERAAKLTKHRSPAILETLAAAYAAAGRFDCAVTTMQKAITLTSATDNTKVTENFCKKLELYKQKKPPQIPVEKQSANHQ